uniref:ORF42g n=1 Tax=Pinus koraiensis TaxID=88728 RepID=A4QMF5_PINKO|nr:ORF42g [Pinus koraiensis]ABP35492.1 ORF42g [Pinus koraiensis]
MHIILFTHSRLSIRSLSFFCYDWKSCILHIYTIKSLGLQNSV